MWRETLGFEAKLINEEFQVLLANMRNREITQVFRSSWTGDYNDAHTFLQLLQGGNPSNMSGYVSEEYDSLMRVIPIYFYVSKHLVKPRVRGWGDNVLDYHYSQHLSIAE
jgi:ABC-type oligopeptide transport system substrate-binding subunit